MLKNIVAHKSQIVKVAGFTTIAAATLVGFKWGYGRKKR